VILQFNADEAPYIKSLPLHRSQQVLHENEMDGYTVKMHVKITPEFINDCILRFGDSVKVISPQSLAESVRQIYLNALELYSKG